MELGFHNLSPARCAQLRERYPILHRAPLLSGEEIAQAQHLPLLIVGSAGLSPARLSSLLACGQIIVYAEECPAATVHQFYRQGVAYLWEGQNELSQTELEELLQQLQAELNHAHPAPYPARGNSLNWQVGLVKIDSAGKVLLWNPAAEKLFGYSAQQAQGKNIKALLTESEQEDACLDLARLKKLAQDTKSSVCALSGKDGLSKKLNLEVLPLPQAEAPRSLMLRFYYQDTVQLEQEADLQRLRLAALARQDIMWEYEVESGRLYWGDNFEQLFGHYERPINNLEEFLKYVEPGKVEALRDSLLHFPPLPQQHWEAEYYFFTARGEARFISDKGLYLRDANAKVTRVIGTMRDLTAKQEYQEQLEKREQVFRKLFENALVGIGMFSLAGECWEANQALANLLGYHQDELLNLHIQKLAAPEEHEVLEQKLEHLRREGILHPFNLKLMRRDRETADCVITGFTGTDKNLQETIWLYVLDISQIQKTAQALELAERRLREHIENASDIFVVLNDQGRYEYISANVEKVLGYRPEEMLGKENLHYMHPDDHPIVGATFEKALENIGSDHRSEFRAKHKEGHWLWVEGNGRFQYNSEGELKALIHIRNHEEEHRIQQKLLKLSKVAEISTNAVIITDPEERIEWVNQSFTHMSGYSFEEALGKTVSELLHGPRSLEPYHKVIKEQLRSGKSFRAESVNYHKRGFPFWIETFVSPIYDNKGQLISYIAVENDISERLQNRKEMETHVNDLRAKNKKLRNFTFTLSHNFHSHAANISALSQELIQCQDPEEETLLKDLLQKSSQQLSDALNSLSKELERNDAVKTELKALKLYPFLQAACEQLSRSIAEENAELDIDLSEDLEILAVPAYLESILYNLISNALRYRHPLRSPKISISARRVEDDYLSLKICDNGLGIDLSKHRNELFSFKKSFHHHPESQGIGLYLVKEHLQNMGGKISVSSQVDRGSCFHLMFKCPPL